MYQFYVADNVHQKQVYNCVQVKSTRVPCIYVLVVFLDTGLLMVKRSIRSCKSDRVGIKCDQKSIKKFLISFPRNLMDCNPPQYKCTRFPAQRLSIQDLLVRVQVPVHKILQPIVFVLVKNYKSDTIMHLMLNQKEEEEVLFDFLLRTLHMYFIQIFLISNKYNSSNRCLRKNTTVIKQMRKSIFSAFRRQKKSLYIMPLYQYSNFVDMSYKI